MMTNEQNRPAGPGTNIVYIVLDDVGFSHLSCYGGDVPTPAMDEIAAGGTQYVNFHTTAICAPTRASLLTGRDHHAVGMGVIPEFNNGTPGCTGEVTMEAATLAEILPKDRYTCFNVGKWHLTPHQDSGPSGPFRQWPMGRGFDKCIGFHGGSTDQWNPDLFRGNERIDNNPDDQRHLSDILVDEALGYLRGFEYGANRSFFMNLAFGACHSPLHAPRKFIDRFRGVFDEGWDVARERVYRRQLERGIIPEGTVLPPREPGVQAWDELPAEDQALFARMQEVFAGFLAHTDAAVGRFIEGLKRLGVYDDCLVVLLSDNGASEEGGARGRSEMLWFDDIVASDDLETYADELGGPDHHNHYPRGWASVGNTPLRRFKRNVYAGGVRDPLLVKWPVGMTVEPGLRQQYHHVVDIMPTVLEMLDLEMPGTVNGHRQLPVDGQSLLYTAAEVERPTPKQVQIYEMWGNRAIWREGWMAIAEHERGDDFATDPWSLYHSAEDFSEAEDLADKEPERLAELVELWHREAERLQVLPLDDRMHGRRLTKLFERRDGMPEVVIYGPTSRLPALLAPGVPTLPGRLDVDVAPAVPGVVGVLCALGGRFGGWSLFVLEDRLHFDYTYYSVTHSEVVSERLDLEGVTSLGFSFVPSSDSAGRVTLWVDGREVGGGEVDIVPLVHSSLEPFEVGADSLTPVSARYASPYRFTGEILQVRGDRRSAIPTDWEPQAEALIEAQ